MSRERVSVEVLGPLRVRDVRGEDVTPTGALQRRLLALLVLRRGHPVSLDVAIDALWPTQVPSDPVAAVHNHVSRLRSVLPDGSLEWVGDAYRLDPAALDLDVERLTARLAEPERRPDDGELDEVLARWHGPAYPELEDVEAAWAELGRLEEVRLHAREEHAARRLATGSAEGVVAELHALVRDEPLRERPRALLMDALVAAGRTADALRAFDDFRRLLVDELGTEPSPALTARHVELLGGGPREWVPTHRLPVPPTRLLGREPLVVQSLAAARDHRLVTLIGPGGVGKTRLVTEVGHRLGSLDADRPVVFCALATATPSSAHEVVVATLEISPRPGVPALDRLVDALSDREVTLILDNCEHVLEPTAVLAERLLARCPKVHLLTTSRERIRVGGEHLIAVPPLELDRAAGPAVELFLERARAVAPAFDPDDVEAAAIQEIVTRLDGLPLAIELAASRLQTHDVAEIATGLDHRFALLSAGVRTSTRHGSLEAAVAWSFGLLSDDLQRAFAALSVFAGAFTVDAASAVASLGRDEARGVLDELVERSLVVRRPDRRYVLLETLRAFGAEQLESSDRAEPAMERHAQHQVDWLEATIEHLPEPSNRTLVEVEDSLPDLRAALTLHLDRRDAAAAARLVEGLFDYGFLRLRPDVLSWADRVTALDPDDSYPRAPQVRAIAGYAAWMAGDVGRLGAEVQRARDAEARWGAAPEVAGAWASHALFEGRLVEALEWYERGAELATGMPGRHHLYLSSALLARAYADDPGTEAAAEALLHAVGDVDTPYVAYAWYCAGESDLRIDPARARARYSKALELAERSGATFVQRLARASRASIEARVGDAEAARHDYRRLLDEWRRAGMWSSQWTMLRAVAGLLHRLGKHHDAAVLVGAVSHTPEGHRIFGADAEVLRELTQRLSETLGGAALDAALSAGSRLDGDAAVEHARRAL